MIRKIIERTPQVKSEILAAIDLLRSPEGEPISLSASSAGGLADGTNADNDAGEALPWNLSL
jgi:hypothetical protein